jgi:Fe-S-cluster containining protein
MAKRRNTPPEVTIFRKDMMQDGAHSGHYDFIKDLSAATKRLIGDTIQYKCQQCGDCCKKGFSIELSIDEMDYLSKEHPQLKTVFAYTKGDYVHPFFNTGPECTMLDKNRCSIYKTRPFECKYYPFQLVEVEKGTIGAYEFGRKYFQLYVFEDCPGIDKGEPWSPRKMNMFMKRILSEYVRHRGMLKITYKVLTTDAFFKDRKQYGTGIIYGTDIEIREFLRDFKSKRNDD